MRVHFSCRFEHSAWQSGGKKRKSLARCKVRISAAPHAPHAPHAHAHAHACTTCVQKRKYVHACMYTHHSYVSCVLPPDARNTEKCTPCTAQMLSSSKRLVGEEGERGSGEVERRRGEEEKEGGEGRAGMRQHNFKFYPDILFACFSASRSPLISRAQKIPLALTLRKFHRKFVTLLSTQTCHLHWN